MRSFSTLHRRHACPVGTSRPCDLLRRSSAIMCGWSGSPCQSPCAGAGDQEQPDEQLADYPGWTTCKEGRTYIATRVERVPLCRGADVIVFAQTHLVATLNEAHTLDQEDR